LRRGKPTVGYLAFTSDKLDELKNQQPELSAADLEDEST
jgi:hypothetical protein